MKTITVGKSRKIRGFKNESWIKCEIRAEFEHEPTLAEIQDMAGDVELVLLMEEDDERDGPSVDEAGGGVRAPVDDFLERAVLGARDVDGQFERGGLGLGGGRTFGCDLGVGGEGHGGQQQPREEAEDHGRIIGRASERRLRLPCMGQG